MTPSFPDIGGAFADAIEPLLRPLLEVRDRVLTWRADANAVLMAWLAEAVTYIGNRIWQAVGQQGHQLLRQVTTVNDFTHILTEVPAEWTYRNPVVWSLWATITGCFLAFLGLQLGAVIATASHKRRQGSPWGDLFDDGFQLLLGVGGAFLSPVGAVLVILVVNIMTALVVQESTVLPGMPPATTPEEAGRNAALLLLYGAACVALLMERVASVAVVMLCLVLSGWGIGSYFWPHMGNWWRVWRTLMMASLGSMLLQNILLRLGGETINRVLREAPAETVAGNFLGLLLGLTCVVLCILAPGLLAGGYAAGAVIRVATRATRPVTGPVTGAVNRATGHTAGGNRQSAAAAT